VFTEPFHSNSRGADPIETSLSIKLYKLHPVVYKILNYLYCNRQHKKKSGLSPPANYADRATAAFRRS
jgi:hypothetical protein